jgi:hypothetical protein
MFGVQCQDYEYAVLHVFIRQHVTSCTAVKGGFVNRVTQTYYILSHVGTCQGRLGRALLVGL